MNKDTLRQWVNVVVIAITIVMNILANALPFNGQNTGEISDRFKVFFVPAGYVFSIWGLIYIGLIAFAVYQALPAQRDNPRLRRVGYMLAVGNLANVGWLFLWHYNRFPLTLVAMLLLLAMLILSYLRLEIGRSRVSLAETWLVRVPVSVYLGWITVATIANVTDVLYDLGWTGGGIGPQTWAVIMLAAAILISAAVSLTRGDVAYLLVIAWAAAGIAIKQADAPAVATSAWIATGAALVLAAIAVVVARRRPADRRLAQSK